MEKINAHHSEIKSEKHGSRPMVSRKALLALSFGALGVVYGDIGTSPLYAMSQIFFGHGDLTIQPVEIFGAVSLVFWALTLIVTIKYVVFVLRAEYEGEGGIFALLGLLRNMSTKGIAFISGMLVLAAGLLLGDGTITPAISVLSAVEGLSVKTAAFEPYIIPLTVLVLSILFIFQYKGTTKLGKAFGGIMCVWFVSIAVLGFSQVLRHPQIIAAINPLYAINFIATVGVLRTMFVLGAVVLAVTGGEALYADLGHFGVKPIRVSWLSLVYPALILNYMGQGAFMLSGAPIIAHNLFYSLVPGMFLVPMIILATLATVIASQALISGAFSLAAQASALGVAPQFKVVHTSQAQKGQIYVPAINWALYIGCMALVIVFRSSSNLAAAYGLAEIGVMVTTSTAMYAISRYKWRWPRAKSTIVFGGFFLIDFIFLASNSLKFLEGGYVPLAIGFLLFCTMTTWRMGRKYVHDAYDVFEAIRPLSWLVDLKQRIEAAGGVLNDEMGRTVELARAIVFLSSKPVHTLEDPVPVVGRVFLKRKGALPKCLVLLNVSIEKEAYVNRKNYYDVVDFGSNVYAVNAHYGFMEEPHIRQLLSKLNDDKSIPYDLTHATIEVAEPEVIIDENMRRFNTLWLRFYKVLYQLATETYRYFGLGSDINTSVTNVPVYMTPEGTEVIRLDSEKLMI